MKFACIPYVHTFAYSSSQRLDVLFDCDRDLLSMKAICSPVDESIFENMQEESEREMII
jgi:hypothetical protein